MISYHISSQLGADLASLSRFSLGQIISQRWKWNETIGPLSERPGRLGDWCECILFGQKATTRPNAEGSLNPSPLFFSQHTSTPMGSD